MLRKKNIHLIYLFIFLGVASIGLNNSLGITRGEFNPPKFYTTLSGLICFLYFLVAAVNGIIHRLQKKELPDSLFWLPRAKGAVTICITVTFLVYHFLVYDGPLYTIDYDIYNFLPHYVVPLMVIFHWIIFDQKGVYKKFDPLFWLAIPIAYFSWANVMAILHQTTPYWDDKFYPYGFMDLTLHPLPQVILTIIALLIFFIGLGYLLYFADQRLGNVQPTNRTNTIKNAHLN